MERSDIPATFWQEMSESARLKLSTAWAAVCFLVLPLAIAEALGLSETIASLTLVALILPMQYLAFLIMRERMRVSRSQAFAGLVAAAFASVLLFLAHSLSLGNLAHGPMVPRSDEPGSFSGFVSQHIPWFWGVLAWSLAIVGLLALAAIPAYFLLYPITTNVRRGVASYLSRLVSKQSAAREGRRRAVEVLIEDFKDNSGITYVSERLTYVEAALGSFSEIIKTLKPQLARVSDLEGTFERLVASVAELREGVAAAVVPRRLTTAEAHYFTSLAGMWFLLTLLSLFLVTTSGLYAFFPYIGLRAAFLVSVDLATCFLILGLLLPRGELLLDGARNRRLIVTGSVWRRKTAVTLAVIALAGFGILLWRVGVTRYQAAFCILLLVLCGALSSSASQASATGKGLRIWFRLCVGVLFAMVEGILRLNVRIFLAVIFCLEVVALTLAAPAFRLRGLEMPSLHAVDEGKRQALSTLAS